MLLLGTAATVLVIGFVAGSLARLLLRHWAPLRWSEFMVAAIVGSAVGGAITEPFLADPHPLDWRVMLASLGGTLVVASIAGPILRRRSTRDAARRASPSVEQMIAAGESGSVEFKSSARWNYRTSKRDEDIELVIAKTVAGFLNSEGGTLLIGVNDDGKVLGLDPDYQLMQRPDRDRYELWLRDLLARCLGQRNATLVSVSFEYVGGRDICRLDVAPAPAPVFVDIPKGPRTADFYVRAGNSTRRLLTDEVLDYQSHRWP
ncbi:MAG TPA: ATP-binding protein [Acidimicrobiales bacterium]|nr:ATP-binding protein [Acidimicrobiales bacterium]